MYSGFDRRDSIVHRHFDRFPLKMMLAIVSPAKSYSNCESVLDLQVPLFL